MTPSPPSDHAAGEHVAVAAATAVLLLAAIKLSTAAGAKSPLAKLADWMTKE